MRENVFRFYLVFVALKVFIYFFIPAEQLFNKSAIFFFVPKTK